jgi:hypothetical protein
MARPPKYTCDESYFENINSHNKAYSLGFLWADGHNNPRSGVCICLHKKDEEILDYFKRELNCDAPIKYRGDYCIFSINRLKIYNDLKSLGMHTNKSINNLEFPKISKEFISSFILGMFDGDGSIYHKETSFAVSFANGYVFLDTLVDILNSVGINTNPIRYRYGSDKPQACQLDITGLENISRLKNFMYKDVNFFMGRKHTLFKEAEQKFVTFSETNKRYNGELDKVYWLYTSGISQAKISNDLNIKYSTVRAIIQRGRKKLEII